MVRESLPRRRASTFGVELEMDNPKLAHEPALKEDGTVYRPYIFDDTGRLQGYTCLLCRLCHAYYADLDAAPAWDRESGDPRPFPALLSGASVCPAKLYEALKETAL